MFPNLPLASVYATDFYKPVVNDSAKSRRYFVRMRQHVAPVERGQPEFRREPGENQSKVPDNDVHTQCLQPAGDFLGIGALLKALCGNSLRLWSQTAPGVMTTLASPRILSNAASS